MLVLTSLGGAVALNSGVVGMATGEAGGAGGCNAGPQAVPEQVPEDVNAGRQIVNPQGGEAPSDAFLETFYVKGFYSIKLTPKGAAEIVVDGDDLDLGPELSKILDDFDLVNPTFHFHDGDSPLIQHYLDEYRAEAELGHEFDRPRGKAEKVRDPYGKRVRTKPERKGGERAQPELKDRIGIDRIVQVQLSGDRNEILDALEDTDLLEWAEPLVVDVAASVNDAYYGYQWNMSAMAADDIWAITTGEGTMVAVLDTGVSVHADGIDNLLANDCYDFVAQSASCPVDTNGHGTHIAGTIAQSRHNEIGVVGLAPGVDILPVRVLDLDGRGTVMDIAAGIVYAVDKGADVLNLSFGGYVESMVRYEAIQYAERRDVSIVASVGNDGFSDTITYPAAYKEVIAVGAVDMAGNLADYSNRSKTVSVLAPGGNLSADEDGDGVPDGILQETQVDGKWGYYANEGTSSAAAHVSAIVALLHSNGVTKPMDIHIALKETKDDLDMVSPLDVLRKLPKTEKHLKPNQE